MDSIFQLLLILIVIAIPFIIVKLNQGKKRMTIKVTHWLLYIYIGVLLLSMCLLSFLSDRMVEGREKVSKEQINVGVEEYHKALYEGNLEKISSQDLLKSSSFPYQQPTLKIYYNGTSYSQVYVERKTIDDGTIDAYVYAHGLIIGGYDFTDKLKPLHFAVSTADDTLTISSQAERERLKISLLKNEFPITQFSDQTKLFDVALHEEPAVYLRIPKGVKLIEDQDLDLIYVGDNS